MARVVWCSCGALMRRRVVGNEYGGPEPVPHAELVCDGCKTVVADWDPDYVFADEEQEREDVE